MLEGIRFLLKNKQELCVGFTGLVVNREDKPLCHIDWNYLTSKE